MIRTRNQITFDPLDHGFCWTEEWYEWDSAAGHKAALSARNQEIRKIRKSGRKARAFSLPSQLRTVGGIGSGHPEISNVVTVYGINMEPD